MRCEICNFCGDKVPIYLVNNEYICHECMYEKYVLPVKCSVCKKEESYDCMLVEDINSNIYCLECFDEKLDSEKGKIKIKK